jgi:hypothetical protein
LRLERQGLIHRKRGTIVDQRALLDRWLSAYAEVVRPAWLVGRYRAQARDPEAVERMIGRQPLPACVDRSRSSSRCKPVADARDVARVRRTRPCLACEESSERFLTPVP